MTRRKYAAGIGAIACLLTSTAAFAADATRSSHALPTAQAALPAPTNGVRTSTTLEKKSNALNRDGVIAASILGAVAIGAAIVVVADEDEPDSAG